MARAAFDFLERLKEIDMFFDRRTARSIKTMLRLDAQLRQAGISYAVMGAMAVNAHGCATHNGRSRRSVDGGGVRTLSQAVRRLRL